MKNRLHKNSYTLVDAASRPRKIVGKNLPKTPKRIARGAHAPTTSARKAANTQPITKITEAMNADPYHPDWKRYVGNEPRAVGADVAKTPGSASRRDLKGGPTGTSVMVKPKGRRRVGTSGSRSVERPFPGKKNLSEMTVAEREAYVAELQAYNDAKLHTKFQADEERARHDPEFSRKFYGEDYDSVPPSATGKPTDLPVGELSKNLTQKEIDALFKPGANLSPKQAQQKTDMLLKQHMDARRGITPINKLDSPHGHDPNKTFGGKTIVDRGGRGGRVSKPPTSGNRASQLSHEGGGGKGNTHILNRRKFPSRDMMPPEKGNTHILNRKNFPNKEMLPVKKGNTHILTKDQLAEAGAIKTTRQLPSKPVQGKIDTIRGSPLSLKTVDEYKTLVARQNAGEKIDLNSLARPGIAKSRDNQLMILQGAGRYEKARPGEYLDLFVPSKTKIPKKYGAEVIEENISGEVVKNSNLLSSRGAKGTNPRIVNHAVKGVDSWKRVRIPAKHVEAPTSKVMSEIEVELDRLKASNVNTDSLIKQSEDMSPLEKIDFLKSKSKKSPIHSNKASRGFKHSSGKSGVKSIGKARKPKKRIKVEEFGPNELTPRKAKPNRSVKWKDIQGDMPGEFKATLREGYIPFKKGKEATWVGTINTKTGKISDGPYSLDLGNAKMHKAMHKGPNDAAFTVSKNRKGEFHISGSGTFGKLGSKMNAPGKTEQAIKRQLRKLTRFVVEQ